MREAINTNPHHRPPEPTSPIPGPATKLPILPTESWLNIFEHLDYTDLNTCKRACKFFSSLTTHPTLNAALFRGHVLPEQSPVALSTLKTHPAYPTAESSTSPPAPPHIRHPPPSHPGGRRTRHVPRPAPPDRESPRRAQAKHAQPQGRDGAAGHEGAVPVLQSAGRQGEADDARVPVAWFAVRGVAWAAADGG